MTKSQNLCTVTESYVNKCHTVFENVVIKLSEPKLIECINKIKSVLNGQTTREEVSDWAGTYF
ncbi:hypothetical protein MOC18_19820, partial [Bacillus spizizenii]|nr:hypothetical protein [Bacillus spizizenii]